MIVNDIFISKNIDENGYLKKVTKLHSISLQGYPLIEISPIAFDSKIILPPASWIFFSSINTVKYFFELCQIESKYNYGCIGLATSKELLKYNAIADFVGNKNEMEKVAEDFAIIVKNEKVIFPQSNISLQTIQKYLNSANIYNLVLYQTSPLKKVKIVTADILVFTSPSNVKSYFNENKLSPKQKVIAIGKSTSKAVNEYGYTCQISKSTTEEDIWKEITALMDKS